MPLRRTKPLLTPKGAMAAQLFSHLDTKGLSLIELLQKTGLLLNTPKKQKQTQTEKSI